MQEKIHIEVKEKQEFFTHLDLGGVYRTFPITTMLEMAYQYAGKCKEIEFCRVPIEDRHISYIERNGGLEQARLDRLIGQYLRLPLLLIRWKDDNSVTIIDGNHRYYKLWKHNIKKTKAIIFDQVLWEQFVIPIVNPAEQIVKPSGILDFEKENGGSTPHPFIR